MFVCPSSLFPSSKIQYFDASDHVNHIFSESLSHWKPVPHCSDPVLSSTDQYRPVLTQYHQVTTSAKYQMTKYKNKQKHFIDAKHIQRIAIEASMAA